jgi:hypothetical protein
MMTAELLPDVAAASRDYLVAFAGNDLSRFDKDGTRDEYVLQDDWSQVLHRHVMPRAHRWDADLVRNVRTWEADEFQGDDDDQPSTGGSAAGMWVKDTDNVPRAARLALRSLRKALQQGRGGLARPTSGRR